MPTHHAHSIGSLSLSLQGVITYWGLEYWVSVLNNAFSSITALNTGFFVLFHMGSVEEYSLSQHSNESEHYASSMEWTTNRFAQLIALSDGIVWLWVANGRSVAASSHFDSSSILNEGYAVELSMACNRPNEAITEENESQKMPCGRHYWICGVGWLMNSIPSSFEQMDHISTPLLSVRFSEYNSFWVINHEEHYHLRLC